MIATRITIAIFISTFWALAALALLSLTTLPPFICAAVVWLASFSVTYCAVGMCQVVGKFDDALDEARKVVDDEGM